MEHCRIFYRLSPNYPRHLCWHWLQYLLQLRWYWGHFSRCFKKLGCTRGLALAPSDLTAQTVVPQSSGHSMQFSVSLPLTDLVFLHSSIRSNLPLYSHGKSQTPFLSQLAAQQARRKTNIIRAIVYLVCSSKKLARYHSSFSHASLSKFESCSKQEYKARKATR